MVGIEGKRRQAVVHGASVVATLDKVGETGKAVLVLGAGRRKALLL